MTRLDFLLGLGLGLSAQFIFAFGFAMIERAQLENQFLKIAIALCVAAVPALAVTVGFSLGGTEPVNTQS